MAIATRCWTKVLLQLLKLVIVVAIYSPVNTVQDMPGNTLTLIPNSFPLTLVSLGETVMVLIQLYLLVIVHSGLL